MKGKRILRGFIFYIVGLLVGSILVYQLWIKNRTDLPNMWPGGRVKDKIDRSAFTWDSLSQCFADCYGIGDASVKNFVNNGKVRFGISKPRRTPPVYSIDGSLNEKWNVRMTIESGEKYSRLLNIVPLPENSAPINCECNPVPF